MTISGQISDVTKRVFNINYDQFCKDGGINNDNNNNHNSHR